MVPPPPPNMKNDFEPSISDVRGFSGGFRLDFRNSLKFESRNWNSQARAGFREKQGIRGTLQARASNYCLESGTPRLGSGVRIAQRSFAPLPDSRQQSPANTNTHPAA